MNIKILVISLTCILSSPVFSEVVINGAGDSIRLNNDNTWEKISTKTRSTIYRGSGETLFEIFLSIENAVIFADRTKDKFTGKKTFNFFETVCRGTGFVQYYGKKPMAFVYHFSLWLEHVDRNHSQSVVFIPYFDEVMNSGYTRSYDTWGLTWVSDQHQANSNISFNDMPKYENSIKKKCDWKNIKEISYRSGSVEFSDGTKMEANEFRDHVVTELIHKDAVLKKYID